MKFTKVYCSGRENGKLDEDDFVVGYRAEDGQYIDTVFVGNAISGYRVEGDRTYGHLKDAKAACERIAAEKAEKASRADIPSMIKELERMQDMKEFILEEYEYFKEIGKNRPLSVSETSRFSLLEHIKTVYID